MRNRLKPIVVTTAIMMGSFCTPTAIRLAHAQTSHDLTQLEGITEFVGELTGTNTTDIKEVVGEMKLANSFNSLGQLNEVKLTTEEDLNQIKSTFNIGDWIVSETGSQIVLTSYKGAAKAIYIPGEYNQKQVVLKSFSILPDNLTSIQMKAVNGKKVKSQSTSLYRALANKNQLTTVDLSGLDTSNITNMSEMFVNSASIQKMNLKGWQTSNVQNMSGMFKGVKQLKSLDINHFKTDNVTDFNRMFFGMESLEFLDISSLKTTKATSLYQIFGNMFNLKAVDLSAFKSTNSVNVDSMFYCSGSSTCSDPLLAIVDDTKIEKAYKSSSLERKLGANMVLELNGGNVNGASTYTYPAHGFFLPFTEADLELTVSVCQIFTPAKRENYILNGWGMSQASSNRLERWYYQLNGPYVAQWSPVSYSTVTTSNTSISGKGMPGGNVQAIVDGNVIGETKVDQSGNYQLKISKQKRGTEIIVVMNGMTLEPVYKTLTVLGELTTFTNTPLTPTSTTITGTGVVGAKVGIYTNNGTRLAITTVDSKGNYQLTIPKQPAGTVLTLKQAKSGYLTVSKKLTALYELKDLKITTVPSISTTAIYGTGEPGANVKAFVDGKAISALTPVNSKGNYKLVIPKQAAGSTIQIKMAKTNYRTLSETVTVQDEFKTFTYNVPTISTTTINGKGVAGAKVGVYTSNGTRLAITTVDSKGNYQLTIPKQKAGTVLSFRQAKSGYIKLCKDVTVLNEFKTFTIKNTTTSSVAIYGTGEPGANVKAFVNGKAISSLTAVNSKGNYKIVIPKQRAGTVVQVKMAKSGYQTMSNTTTILDEFKTFTHSKLTTSTTTISGKGVAGAKVGIYTSSGTRLAITTVNSKGNYQLTIPKQKNGTVLSIRQAKSGYLTLSKNMTVVKG